VRVAQQSVPAERLSSAAIIVQFLEAEKFMIGKRKLE